MSDTDFDFPAPGTDELTRFRFRVDQADAHVHLRLFVGPADGTLALAGRLVLDPGQWRTLMTVLAIQEHVAWGRS